MVGDSRLATPRLHRPRRRVEAGGVCYLQRDNQKCLRALEVITGEGHTVPPDWTRPFRRKGAEQMQKGLKVRGMRGVGGGVVRCWKRLPFVCVCGVCVYVCKSLCASLGKAGVNTDTVCACVCLCRAIICVCASYVLLLLLVGCMCGCVSLQPR